MVCGFWVGRIVGLGGPAPFLFYPSLYPLHSSSRALPLQRRAGPAVLPCPSTAVAAQCATFPIPSFLLPIHSPAPAETGGLRRFALAIHCGGCMVDHQKIRARIMDLKEAGVPVTNYGLLLSYAHSPAALERALQPWGLHV